MLSSIRKPKRLIIRGDDEKDHMFLVKGGEDLRLDQRIEQVSISLTPLLINNSVNKCDLTIPGVYDPLSSLSSLKALI